MISLNEVKQSLGITFNSQDDYLTSLLYRVVGEAEKVTGYNFIDDTKDHYLDLNNQNNTTCVVVKDAVLQHIDFLYSKRGDLENKRNDSFYLVLRRFCRTGKSFF